MTFVAIADKDAGDLVTEAMWDAIKDDINSGVFRPLAETLLSGSAASIDIQNIPQTHAGLLIVIGARSTNAASGDSVRLRFNNDSAGNYDYQYHYGVNTTRTAAESFGTSIIFAALCPDANSGTGAHGQSIIYVPGYANATTHKAATIQNTSRSTTASGGTYIFQAAGVWRSTAAITRVTVSTVVGSMAAGSRLTIYGTGAGI